jgi:cysteinyl-tRNA synthetase
MTIRFTNTLGSSEDVFEPLDPPRVRIYVCGPTVYDIPHVGHARAAVVFDVLRRHLVWRGYDVFFVRNITDVDDKIIKRANDDGVDSAVIAERYTRVYQEAMQRLNVLPPDLEPRASAHIPEMLELIGRLEQRGYAYAGEGSVYFSVEKFDGYGKLSGRGLDDLANRERVEAAPGKHHPLDFALWKAAKPEEPAWSSPWGPGRPGWHIECSAMSERYLGQPFDIHGGGADLIFPHHENEIAQSEAANDAGFARYWLHNGHVQIRGEKMSKSLRNYVNVHEVLEDYPAEVLRIFFAGAHYRSQMDYGPDGLEEAKAVWERFRSFLRIAKVAETAEDAVNARLEPFGEAMDDDLNTPGALAALHDLVRQGHSALERGEHDIASEVRAAVAKGLEILGCRADTDARGSGGGPRFERTDLVGPLVELLLGQREAARKAKDFTRADEIRERLATIGVQVEDSAQGPRWFLS